MAGSSELTGRSSLGGLLVIVLGVYIVVQLAYCFWLKHQAVLDICIVAFTRPEGMDAFVNKRKAQFKHQ